MNRLYIFIIVFSLLCSCGKNEHVVKIKIIDNYPSASGIEYFENNFYIIGDDAKNLLVLDDKLNIKDSIALYDLKEYRFPKEIKPDLEAITVLHTDKGYRLLVLGSGSLIPYRNTGWIIDPVTKQKGSVYVESFYKQLKIVANLPEINFEGLCAVQNGILIANRGHLGYPENHLLFIDDFSWLNPAASKTMKISIDNPTHDTSTFSGISGLAYSAKSDRLFLTLSTEMTASSFTDGAIGKSYLWIVNNFYEKRLSGKTKPDKIIDLEELDKRFKGQKIESVCLVSETKTEVRVAMVADNDNGSSTVIKLTIKPG